MDPIVFRIQVKACRRSYVLTSMGLLTNPVQLYDSVELSVEGELLEPDDVKGRTCKAHLKGERKIASGFKEKLRDWLGAKKIGEMTEQNGEISFKCSLPLDAALGVLSAVGPDGLNEIFLAGQEFENGTIAFDSLVVSNFSNAYEEGL